MKLPKSAIFAFNANPDYVRLLESKDLDKIKRFSKPLFLKMHHCFKSTIQREVIINEKTARFLASSFAFKKTIGGQAGNAAQQAAYLCVDCFLHTNNLDKDFLHLFRHPNKILVASKEGFLPCNRFQKTLRHSLHFVFVHKRTRFIASFDPRPLAPEPNFCKNINAFLPSIQKAFIGGIHLVKSKSVLFKFASCLRKWKKLNPNLQIFLEMGEFSDIKMLHLAEKEILPLADIIGLNEVEASQLSLSLKQLSSQSTVLFHSPKKQFVLPSADKDALLFARKCASFKAQTGKFATLQDLQKFSPTFVRQPRTVVGLGDIFSCAYFLSI